MRCLNRISVASVSKPNLLLWHVRRSNSFPRKKEKNNYLKKETAREGEWKQRSHSSIIQIYEFMVGAERERERERDCGKNECCCYSSIVAL